MNFLPCIGDLINDRLITDEYIFGRLRPGMRNRQQIRMDPSADVNRSALVKSAYLTCRSNKLFYELTLCPARDMLQGEINESLGLMLWNTGWPHGVSP